MKDFFKNRTWDDYLAMVVIGLVIGGLVIFFIGYYWGFTPNIVIDLPGVETSKVSIHKITSGKNFSNVAIGLEDKGYNLFSLAGAIDPSFGMMYAMVFISLLGFSMLMLGLAMILVVIIFGFIYDTIQKKKQK